MENNSYFYASSKESIEALPTAEEPGKPNALAKEALEERTSPRETAGENTGSDQELVFTPLDWGENNGSTADTGEKPILLAQAEIKEEKAQEEPEEKKTDEEIAREQEDKLRQSLRAAFLKPEDGSTKKPEEIVEALEQIKLPELDKIENIKDLDIPEIDDRIEFEPDLWHKIKENPLISILVAYGGYQVIKQGRKFVLQRTRAEAEGGKAAESGEKKQAEAEPERAENERRVETEEPRSRRSRLMDAETATKFDPRVETERNSSGAFEKTVASGSEAIAGTDRVSERLTKTELDSLKEEIKRLSESKVEAENKRAGNLERVVKILENSESPKVQEAAHKYIKNRMAEAKEAEARRGRGARVGAAVGVGILVSAALAYYVSTLDHGENPEEEERASVSGK